MARETFDATINPKYLQFIKSADSFFGVERYVRQSFPEWDSNERQLITQTLPNGMVVDMNLTFENPFNSYQMTVIYPEGARQQPASHFIEHMLTDPQGLEDRVFRLFSDSQIMGVDGSTDREVTGFFVSNASFGFKTSSWPSTGSIFSNSSFFIWHDSLTDFFRGCL